MAVTEKEIRKLPRMVRWFSPSVLKDAARRAILSALFGEYADRRLIQAALDPVDNGIITERFNYVTRIKPNDNGEVWIDYVADLGDGFDSTYSIAWFLAQKSFKIDGHVLPRGNVLVMGGDQVYPAATREDYESRFKRPYKYAFPASDRPDADHPPVFLIPGNHDWYDGLTLFLALFCRGRKTALGSWEAWQNRSYFAIRLPDNWWIWGIDTQLGEDIDLPQASYFVSVAKQMPENSKLILCTSVPTWLKADMKSKNREEKNRFFRALNYIAYDLLKDNCPTTKICAVLSGDLHHYSRYSALESGTQFITAGGGGAFLHPTHHLKDTINTRWLREDQILSLRTDPANVKIETDKEACFPSRKNSRKLVLGNLKFFYKNLDFSMTLGGLYALLGTIVQLTLPPAVLADDGIGFSAWLCRFLYGTLDSPSSWIIAAGILLVTWGYASSNTRSGRLLAGLPHGIIQGSVLFTATAFFSWLSVEKLDLQVHGMISRLVFCSGMTVFSGMAAGFIWGLYLLIVNFTTGHHENDAFSAMRLDTYKNCLRMRIKGDTLTIYPVGLETPASRDEWMPNPKAEKNNQDEPEIIPSTPPDFHLIEEPVVINASDVLRVNEQSGE